MFNVYWEEWAVGLVILAISLFFLIVCLICLTKILSSMFKGPTGKLLTKWVNSDLPGVGKYFTGFIAITVIFYVSLFISINNAQYNIFSSIKISR